MVPTCPNCVVSFSIQRAYVDYVGGVEYEWVAHELHRKSPMTAGGGS